MIRYMQIILTNEHVVEPYVEEPGSCNDVSMNLFEFALEIEDGEDFYVRFDDPNCVVFTRAQHAKADQSGSSSTLKYILTKQKRKDKQLLRVCQRRYHLLHSLKISLLVHLI